MADVGEVLDALVVLPGDTVIFRLNPDTEPEQMVEFKAHVEAAVPGLNVLVTNAEQMLVVRGGDADG